jgi:hypothetical protein
LSPSSTTPNDITVLAEGTINGDQLVVQLIRPHMLAIERTLHPTVVRIVWPLQPSIVSPANFPDTAAQIARLFAEAATTLAQIKAWRRL